MSFGRPGGFTDSFKVSPPQRGSFPLDHDGECKTVMLKYMRCLKANKNDAGQCRPESRAYLECRMDNGLMTRDDFQNLGLGDVASTPGGAGASASNASASANATAGATAGATSTSQSSGGRYVPSERI